ncbi:MAG: hypothetical protein AB1755_05230 [Candidatus Omnitrophota bacterium]
MTQNIDDLIEKINQEGVLAAEKKAKDIENNALRKAEEIISDAKIKSQNLLNEAKDRIEKMSQKEKELINQAARDMLISLRKEINSMLDKITIHEVHKALSTETMVKIISGLIKEYKGKEDKDVVIDLSKEDLHILERVLLSKLKEETKKQIILKTSSDIKGGFLISFDANKSHYDFSDKAIAEYIGTYLKPKLNEILKETVK